MGREHKKRRSMKIGQAQKRKTKLLILRKKYFEANMDSDKERVWQKVFKLAPWLTKEEFLKPGKPKEEEIEEEK